MTQITTGSGGWTWWFPVIEAVIFFAAGAIWSSIRRYVRHPEDALVRQPTNNRQEEAS